MRNRLSSLGSRAAGLWRSTLRHLGSREGGQGWTLVDLAMSIFGVALGLVAGYAVGFWLIVYLPNPNHPYVGGSLFTLAQVMAIFGAFGFAAGFSKYGNSGLRSQLRSAGAFHILSALGFTLLGMVFPISTNESIWKDHGDVLGILNGVALAIAILGFSLGTILWVSQFHRLLGMGSARDSDSDSSSHADGNR